MICFGRVRVRHYHDELLSAKLAGAVRIASESTRIPHIAAVTVVDGLEVVDVDQQHGE